LASWIKKEDPIICCLQEIRIIDRNKHWFWLKGWKKIYQNNDPQKQVGEATLFSDKIDFKLTLINEIKMDTHTNKRRNTPKGNNNYQPVCTKVSAPNFTKHTLNNIKAY
jgi:exonuclease III